MKKMLGILLAVSLMFGLSMPVTAQTEKSPTPKYGVQISIVGDSRYVQEGESFSVKATAQKGEVKVIFYYDGERVPDKYVTRNGDIFTVQTADVDNYIFQTGDYYACAQSTLDTQGEEIVQSETMHAYEYIGELTKNIFGMEMMYEGHYAYTFVAEKTARYSFTFYSFHLENNRAIVTEILEEDLTPLKTDSHCAETGYKEYTVTANLIAGKTYYLVALNSTYNNTAGFTYNIVCDHSDLTYTKASAGHNGSMSHTYCGKCNTLALPDATIYGIKNVTLEYSKVAYSGKAKKPAVKVTDNAGNVIKKSNYTVTYSNNKNVGTATVKITFKNLYSGSITKTFQIVPDTPKLLYIIGSKVNYLEIRWEPIGKSQCDGYQVQYAKNASFSKDVKTKTVKLAKSKSTYIKDGAYYARVRAFKTVNGKKYYSAWSNVEKP